MKKRLTQKILASSLALAMVLGGSTAAFADGKGKGHNREDFNNQRQFDIHLSFEDMRGPDVEWAVRYIASLASRGVFEGYEDGTFKPHKAISRIEAISAAVRLMGLREQAESPEKMQTKLNFKDAEQVPAWAVGYVAVALENDLFTESDDAIQPHKEADRLWATTLLVKALKLDGEAKTKMNTTLPFRDAKQIPAGSVGYVAVAVEKQLIEGFEDNTFRPNEPITRAQLAVLLDRTGEQMPDNDQTAFRGTVNAVVSGNVLALTKSGTTTQLNLHPSAFIYRNGVQVSAAALQVGDEVKVRLFNNQVIFVEVIKMAQAGQTFDVLGTLNGTTLNSGGEMATISINQNFNGTVTTSVYNVSPDVTISGNLSLLVPGHLVGLKGKNQIVTSIEIK